jgi:tetratricopeptide (TPR) repeat protein
VTENATFTDRLGLPIGTANDAAAARYREGVDLYMSGNPGSEAALRNAMAADPGFALAPAALAALLRDTGRHDEAREAAGLARVLAANASPRQKSHVEAIAVMAEGDGDRSFALMRDHLAQYPRDALIMLRADRHLFYSGGENRQNKQREFLGTFAGDYQDDWWFPGQYGFALGECGFYDEAVAEAERSLARNPRNIWAAHTLAHVYADTKDDAKGAGFLGPWLGDFDSRAPMFGHTSWHLSLFELGLGRYRRAMEVYRTGVCPAVCSHRSTLNNSASFLWRCMVYGYETTAEQWDEVQPLAERIAGPAQTEWDGMNAALAFAGGGNERGKDGLAAGLKDLGKNGRTMAVEVGLPLVEGAWAFARRDYADAIRRMAPAIANIESVGGSNAQHEVYWDALIEAYLRTERFDEAETLQRSRLEPRPTARDLFRLGRALLGAGKTEEAEAALRGAAKGWRTADPDSPEVAALETLLKRAGAAR